MGHNEAIEMILYGCHKVSTSHHHFSIRSSIGSFEFHRLQKVEFFDFYCVHAKTHVSNFLQMVRYSWTNDTHNLRYFSDTDVSFVRLVFPGVICQLHMHVLYHLDIVPVYTLQNFRHQYRTIISQVDSSPSALLMSVADWEALGPSLNLYWKR